MSFSKRCLLVKIHQTGPKLKRNLNSGVYRVLVCINLKDVSVTVITITSYKHSRGIYEKQVLFAYV